MQKLPFQTEPRKTSGLQPLDPGSFMQMGKQVQVEQLNRRPLGRVGRDSKKKCSLGFTVETEWPATDEPALPVVDRKY